MKISDGCDRFCSYCTIPYIRGRYHSFPYEQIAEDVEREIASGAREIMLIAQDTGRWGADLPDGRDLAWLVDTLAEAHPDTWFRIMYLQPRAQPTSCSPSWRPARTFALIWTFPCST